MLLRNGKTTNKVRRKRRRLPQFVWKSLTPKPSVEILQEQQIQDLENYIKRLQEQIYFLEEENSERRDENYLLQEENSELRDENYFLEEENSELREQLTWN